MITLIHGEDTAKSREYLWQEKQKAPHVLSFDGEKVTITDLLQALESADLFDTERTVFVENLFTRKKSDKDLQACTAVLVKHHEEKIFLWEEKEVTKKHIQALGKIDIKQFSYPKTLFVFLDSIAPKNGKKLIALFHEALQTAEVELFLFMLIRQIRILLTLVSPDQTETIEEVKRLAPWQKNKLQKQARLFSEEQLLLLYQKLFALEVAQKTGTLVLPLTSSIDFLLIDI